MDGEDPRRQRKKGEGRRGGRATLGKKAWLSARHAPDAAWQRAEQHGRPTDGTVAARERRQIDLGPLPFPARRSQPPSPVGYPKLRRPGAELSD
jgi:hypothetical protein